MLAGTRRLASTSFLAWVLICAGWEEGASNYILPCWGSGLCWLRRGGQQIYPSLLGFWSVLAETRGLATTSFLAGVLICDVWDTGASNYILPCWGSGLCWVHCGGWLVYAVLPTQRHSGPSCKPNIHNKNKNKNNFILHQIKNNKQAIFRWQHHITIKCKMFLWNN